ncbi:patatin-like phospholipase family protein [Roseibium aggregatum]|uniref:Patatin-like phospholipase family protein n=1 Tax=Roseibium aggregatum TaxID=187304 RepID=A0A939ECV9_9HYPH|nr:patatin-like phospholipase family protein [Roseibium aggregatum]MBN9670877.1 patatin-like phospholipase family protein [Roseibium aggregatum]
MPIGLVLGGGAPNLPLMSGALLALDEAGLEYKVISTTGAGMLAGLLYASPQKSRPDDDLIAARRDALFQTQFLGINDLIYKVMPINYKIFQKPGPAAELLAPVFNAWFLRPFENETPAQQFLRDWTALVAATLMPSNLTPFSKGLCQAPSWIEAIVDFEQLVENLGDTLFRLTAYSVEDRKEITFNRNEITIDHTKAALAMPLIYEPFKLKLPDADKPKTFLEGSAFNPLEFNPGDVMVENDIDTIVFMDVLGYRELIDEPRDLTDAWVQSIIAPLTRLAENSLTEFKNRREIHAHELFLREMQQAAETAGTKTTDFKKGCDLIQRKRDLYQLVDLLGSADADMAAFDNRAQAYLDKTSDPAFKDLVDLAMAEDPSFANERESYLKNRETEMVGKSEGSIHRSRTELLRMPFRQHIPEDHWPHVLDWSNFNLTELFEIGRKTGEVFVRTHKNRLENSMGKPLAPEPQKELEAAE